MAEDIKRIDIAEFRAAGYLQELPTPSASPRSGTAAAPRAGARWATWSSQAVSSVPIVGDDAKDGRG